MSDKMSGGQGEVMAERPWEMSFRGRTWRDMPGPYEDEKKLNFFLFRRGLLETEEIEVEAAADLEESQYLVREDGVKVHRQLRGRKKRFGESLALASAGGLNRARRQRLAREEERGPSDYELRRAEHARRREALKARLLPYRSTWGALRQIAKQAGVNNDRLYELLDRDTMGPERLVQIETVMDALDAGRWKLQPMKMGPRPVKVPPPAGHVPFKAWLELQAPELNMQAHSIYMLLSRNPELMPPVFKKNKRRWWVAERVLCTHALRMVEGKLRLITSEAEAERRAA